MKLHTFCFTATLAVVSVLSPSIALADVVGCGGHEPRVLSCVTSAVGAACDTASTTDGTGGTCQTVCADAGTAVPDGGSDGGTGESDCALMCVPSTMHGALTPHDGAWKFFAPWALALVVPIALRKRRRA